jgi:hypothetical protein
MDNANRLLAEIEKRKVKPKPKWFYLTKNGLIWFLLILFALISAFAFAVIIYIVAESDYALFFRETGSVLSFWFKFLPLFWLLFLLIFVIVAVIASRKTKKGYRFKLTKIVAVILLISAMAGVIIYYSGFAKTFESLFAQNLPFYKSLDQHKMAMWQRPESGLLAGEISEIDLSKNKLVLVDFNGKSWQVDIKNAAVKRRVELRVGSLIKVIGYIQESGFSAREIRPWQGRRSTRGRSMMQ